MDQPAEQPAQHPAEQPAELNDKPFITRDNAAQYPPPSLRKYMKAESRGPASAPAAWYLQMTHGIEWNADSKPYKNETKRWRGLMGANERRVSQRRDSFQQTLANREYQQERRLRELEQERELEQNTFEALSAKSTLRKTVPSASQ